MDTLQAELGQRVRSHGLSVFKQAEVTHRHKAVEGVANERGPLVYGVLYDDWQQPAQSRHSCIEAKSALYQVWIAWLCDPH